MPQYAYKAKSGPSEIRSGTIQADNRETVVKRLKADGLFPVSIVEVAAKKEKKTALKKAGSQDVSAFTRQLANLIRSGFNLSAALGTLVAQTQNQRLAAIIREMQEKIQKGAEFSSALNAYPAVFSSFYVNMVKIGETTGRMDETLERLADFKEKETELISQVRSALTYPAFLFAVGIITIFVLTAFFIPRLVEMFADLEQALPLPTIIIMNVSGFMNKFWWLVLIMLAVVIALLRSYYLIERNRARVDAFFLHVPWVRDIILKMEISRFTYALAVLLRSGVPILEALGVVTLSVDNRYLRQRISTFREQIRKGNSLSSCMKAERIFPAILANMAAVGE
ncbi:MAG TPA: type II secretion system F family protein, partial [Candidatus Omnitrophota bacterium]|nr:type II secretion system F family protein [Candidatus Omnitrophota bacterium]